METPCFLACGYEMIQVKSGQWFPLWCVQLDDGRRIWKSKRDIYRLKGIPKTAFRKLAIEHPWARPEVDDFGNENKWEPRFRKNLMKLDQCLQNNTKNAEAWQEFCKETLESPRISNNDIRGSKLGQYFCSDENAMQLVDLFLRELDAIAPDKEFIVVEPSCGYGKLVESLLRRRRGMPIKAYDIDNESIQVCKKRFNKYSTVEFCNANFLQTACARSESRAHVFIGGPPYTTGAGSGAGMDRDLPIRFVKHCATEYNASVIVFLMPERCAKADYDLSEYEISTVPLRADSIFHFQDGKSVKQPSVIQIFRRRET